MANLTTGGTRVGAESIVPGCSSHAPVAADWRAELPRLAPLDLPLLPCGAGREQKGPIDPTTGHGLTGWSSARFSVEQILAMNGVVRSVGTRTGYGLASFDLDGATAIELALEHGCDPQQAHTWQVHRTTDPCRLKVNWRLSPEQQQAIGDVVRKAHTMRPLASPDGSTAGKGEALEFFHSPGRQILVLGNHVPSGGRYVWPDGMGPEALAPIPPEWWALAMAIVRGEVGLPPEQPANRISTIRTGSDRSAWRALQDCPICGRNTTGYCAESRTDGAIRCFHGSTFSPELRHGVLKVGQTVPGSDGTVYGYCSTQQQANGDTFSTFRVHRDRPEAERSRKATGSQPQQGTDPSPAEVARRPYRELLADTLQAIRDGDQDAEMELRAEIMGRFKRSDSQINAALFGLLTKQEGGTTAATYGAIDVSNIAPSHWLIDGFVPANDQVLLYGEAGAGKTTAALELAFAVIEGTGLLDRSAPATAGKVLFISSDSGRRPLLTLMNHAGFEDHPAVRDGRFLIWAHSPEEGRIAWDASVAGCLALLQAIQREGISMVLIDSCKAVTSKAEIDYTSNAQISALLTFFQEVVCQHCSVVWLNHDGTANGATAGAKAWKEIPSSVHSIEMVTAGAERDGEGGKGKAARVNPELRNWRVRKCRQGTAREFVYRVDQMTGRLRVTDAVEIVGDCSGAVLQVLREAHRHGQPSVGVQELQERCLRMAGSYSHKTVRNTLTNLVNARTIVRPGRGRYALSPKQKELMGGGVHAGREDKGKEASERLGSSFVPTPSRARDIGTNDLPPGSDVCPEVPAEKSPGTKANTSEGLGSDGLSSRGAWAPPPEPPMQTWGATLAHALPSAEVIEALQRLRKANPHAAAHTLALDLEVAGLGQFTGAKVASWITQLPEPHSDDAT